MEQAARVRLPKIRCGMARLGGRAQGTAHRAGDLARSAEI